MIELVNVTKTYPSGTEALNNVSLTIEKGEFVFVVGHSGAGKSTLIKMLLREEIPTEGEVYVNGIDLVHMRRGKIPYYRRSIGVVFQDFRLIPSMSVYENVAFSLRVTNVSGKYIRRRVPYILDLLGLTGKARQLPAQLSGGEQQRVALARALVNNPSIIIADEPTGNIDPELSFEIVDLLNEINKKGTTVLMVTHEHTLVSEFDHRVITLNQGRIISDRPAGSSAWTSTAPTVPAQQRPGRIPFESNLEPEEFFHVSPESALSDEYFSADPLVDPVSPSFPAADVGYMSVDNPVDYADEWDELPPEPASVSLPPRNVQYPSVDPSITYDIPDDYNASADLAPQEAAALEISEEYAPQRYEADTPVVTEPLTQEPVQKLAPFFEVPEAPSNTGFTWNEPGPLPPETRPSAVVREEEQTETKAAAIFTEPGPLPPSTRPSAAPPVPTPAPYSGFGAYASHASAQPQHAAPDGQSAYPPRPKHDPAASYRQEPLSGSHYRPEPPKPEHHIDMSSSNAYASPVAQAPSSPQSEQPVSSFKPVIGEVYTFTKDNTSHTVHVAKGNKPVSGMPIFQSPGEEEPPAP